MTWASAARLVVILTVAGILRFADLGRPSVWEDEVVSITLARQPTVSALLDQLPHLDATGAPLHPLLLRAWIQAFGDSLTIDRALSALFGILAVGLVHVLARRAYGEATGDLAAWLQALSPLDVNHSREARMYEGLVVLTCLAWWRLQKLRDAPGGLRLLTYGLVLIALVYTHPLGLLMVAALLTGDLLTCRGSRVGAGRWCVVHLAVALAVLPWIPRYLDHPPESLVAPNGWKALGEWPESFTGGRTEAVFLGGGLVIVGIGVGGRSNPAETRRWLAWLLVPVALLAAYSAVAYPIFAPRRYRVFVGPAYLVLLARGIVALPRKPRLLITGLLTLVAAGASLRVLDPNRPDWSDVASRIRQEDPQAPVVVVDDRANQSVCLTFYLGAHPQVVPSRAASTLWDSRPATFWMAIGQDRQTPTPRPPSRYHRDKSWTRDRVRLEHWSRTPTTH